jgi:hypothetical protein
MLHNKSTKIISEVKDFFTSSEKAIYTILTTLSSLKLSELQNGLEDNCNNEYKNINKLFLVLIFPFFEIKDTWNYSSSSLYPIMSCGKDVFYRLLNDSFISWRRISYKLSMQMISKVHKNSDEKSVKHTRCLIIDDTDLPKTGKRIELIGKIFSHVTQQSILGIKGLFMGYHDGKSFFALDFSLHGERGKNDKKPFGMTKKQLKARFSKKRDKNSEGFKREKEYFTTKIQSMICMIKSAIDNGLRFDYLLVDSWFTCFELVNFIIKRRIKCHLLGMAKMGKTKYFFNGKFLTAKELIDFLRRTKKVKRSKLLCCYYSEIIVDFKGIPIKLLFSKTTRKGSWNLLLSTDLDLNFEQAYKIYSTRWTIEIFFKESKQYLGLGKCESQNFDAQIAKTTLTMIQYNLLTLTKRFSDYESLGDLFRNTKAETIQLTLAEHIWQLIIEILQSLSELFEIDVETLMEKLMSDNEKLTKLSNYKALLQTG